VATGPIGVGEAKGSAALSKLDTGRGGLAATAGS
jgi:hypothetical protein